MKNFDKVTIILITYKSDEIIYDFVKKIPKNIKTIIVENSNNYNMKKKIEDMFVNTSVYLKENQGFSSAFNLAVKNVKTDYFIHLSPDILLNFSDIDVFFEYAKKLNNKFCALGPRFLNTKKRGHNQIKEDIDFGKMKSIHGSYMFFNKESFYEIGEWDENIFLYFEELLFCTKGSKKELYSYQINKIQVQTEGTTVVIKESKEKNKWLNLLIWHFIWSKFYVSKIRFGFFISILFFLPIIFRSLIKLSFHFLLRNHNKYIKYKFRLNGLYNSIIGKKSFLRMENINEYN
tara:strand:- start:1977 stop:2846 length:870 start_codon:yes stop_codon:yes gene_type:complete